ncbi:MAG: phosphoribosyltransferase, partial [Gammaproteobacteria bacterium]
AYRGGRPGLEVRNHTVILVDDGVATGATMRAAIAALKQRKPKRIVVAVPTAAQHTYDELRDEVDDFVCLSIPYPYFSVGSWYGDFSQTRDEEVRALLSDADRQSKVVSGE